MKNPKASKKTCSDFGLDPKERDKKGKEKIGHHIATGPPSCYRTKAPASNLHGEA